MTHIAKPITALRAPAIGISCKGFVQPRVLAVREAFRDVVNRCIETGRGDLIDLSWFRVVRTGPWSPNLITTAGKNALASSDYAYWWGYYHAGTGTAAPLATDTSLGNWHQSSGTRTALPSGALANVHDVEHGRITHSRAWIFPMQTETKTYTEGGLASAAASSSSLNTRFLLGTPATVEAGQYFSPVYKLVWSLTPTTEAATIVSPVLPGWETGAQARIETLKGMLPSLTSLGADDPSDAALYADLGITPFQVGGPALNASYYQLNADYVNSKYRAWNRTLYPVWSTAGHRYSGFFFLSACADALTFGSEGTYITSNTSSEIGAANSTSHFEAVLYDVETEQSYTSGAFQRVQRVVLDASLGNLSGIRSFGLGDLVSPLGSTQWRRRSLFRVLLATPMAKSGGILTVDFTQSWS